MIIILLKFIITIAIGVAVLYYFYRWVRKTSVSDEQRQELEESLARIENIIKTDKTLSKFSVSELDKARKRIKRTLKHGGGQ